MDTPKHTFCCEIKASEWSLFNHLNGEAGPEIAVAWAKFIVLPLFLLYLTNNIILSLPAAEQLCTGSTI